jgi:hypothetical protein
VKQEPDYGKPRLFASRGMIAGRAILAVALLLILVGGSIVLPIAAAGGPVCTLACCAGRAPHAAGSCMHGSCETEVSAPSRASGSSYQAHHHDMQQPAQALSEDVPQLFAGATASVGGSDTLEVPTIEAAPYNSSADTSANAVEGNRAGRSAITAVVKPCQADCGACASSFSPSKWSRNTTTLAGFNRLAPPSPVKLANRRQFLALARSPFYRQSVPRGPPFS